MESIAKLSHNESVMLFLALGLLILVARLLGEVTRRLHQPAVLGEILAGVLLGPTVLGALSPAAFQTLFPPSGPLAVVLDAFSSVAIALFLLVAGLEVDLSTIWQNGKLALKTGVVGMLLPFGLGFAAVFGAPSLLGLKAPSLAFGFFFATALAISALPVIARTLMDLGLYKSELGMVIVAAAVFNDLVGWIVFAFVLGVISPSGGLSPGATLWMTLAFVILMLTLGRALLNRALPLLQKHASWPGGVLSFTLGLALLCAAFTEFLGIHAVFGAFLFGVAIGDSSHLREQTRHTLDRFISFFFAPLFFASIGLKVDFAAHFDLLLTVAVLAIACAGKILGCGLGARWGGLKWRESFAVGFGMNARGAMEIILGLLALQLKLIEPPLFVALVVMALATSMLSGPLMQRLIKKPRAPFALKTDLRDFIPALEVQTVDEAIDALCEKAAAFTKGRYSAKEIAQAVKAREAHMPTGLKNGLALPHARLEKLEAPVCVAALSPQGLDFGAEDRKPAQAIFLLLTSQNQDAIAGLSQIASAFRDAEAADRALRCADKASLIQTLTETHAHEPAANAAL